MLVSFQINCMFPLGHILALSMGLVEFFVCLFRFQYYSALPDAEARQSGQTKRL